MTQYANAYEHELVGVCQTVFWNDWPFGRPLEFLLVDYFRSKVYERGYGVYHVYYAIALADIPELGIIKDDGLILYITYRAWLMAISKLPSLKKRDAASAASKGKSLYVKLEKENTKSIILHDQQVRSTPEELKSNAARFYAIIDQEHAFSQKVAK